MAALYGLSAIGVGAGRASTAGAIAPVSHFGRGMVAGFFNLRSEAMTPTRS
jgi:hypothetical protein